MGAREDSFKHNGTVVTSMKKIQLASYCKVFRFSTKKETDIKVNATEIASFLTCHYLLEISTRCKPNPMIENKK